MWRACVQNSVLDVAGQSSPQSNVGRFAMVLTLRWTDREIHQRSEEALGIDAVRMLSGEDVGQHPVVAHRRHEHGRERGMVLTPRRVLSGQARGEGVVHALELMRPDLLEQ